MASDPNLLPKPVEKALQRGALLFIGYRLGDWNLRLLLQGLRLTRLTLNILVMPAPQGPGPDAEKQKDYLERYYKEMDLKVYWATAREFCGELRRRYRERFPSD
jgi:hypothetical protein